MIEETSSGVVIYRIEENDFKFLLLNYPAGHWDFVKGKMEKGENSMDTAIRETKEETGISDLNFIKDFKEQIEYNFQFDGKLIHKQVFFYLANTKKEEIILSHEHLSFVWLSFNEALKKITYENAQQVLVKANSLLLKS